MCARTPLRAATKRSTSRLAAESKATLELPSPKATGGRASACDTGHGVVDPVSTACDERLPDASTASIATVWVVPQVRPVATYSRADASRLATGWPSRESSYAVTERSSCAPFQRTVRVVSVAPATTSPLGAVGAWPSGGYIGSG